MDTGPATVAELVLRRPPSLGAGRMVCIDGPAGSGKTTMAEGVAGELAHRGCSVRIVHMEDVCEGGPGLAEAGGRVCAPVGEPLAQGRGGGYRRYDWHRQAYAETVMVPPVDVLLIEGVGAGHLRY